MEQTPRPQTETAWVERERKQIQWQRDVMHNHCTICWNKNGWTACAACGFWGYVVPEGWTK